MRFFLGLFVLSILFGCQPRVGSNMWFKKTSIQEVKSHYSKICIDYGFDQRSSQIATCIQKEILAQKERNALDAQRAALASSTSKNVSGMSGFTVSYTKRIN